MHLFYADLSDNDVVLLNEEESFHAAKVLRLKTGETVFVADGKGTFCKALITSNNIKACELRIIERKENYGLRNYFLHIAVAPTKQMERFEWFVEKAVEIGVDEITPLICSHSERKNLKPERVKKIIEAAAKQSLKAFLPKLNETILFEKFVELPFDGLKMIAHCRENKKQSLKTIINSASKKNYLILIGPEGDFDEEEILIAEKKDFKSISLSDSRLRTETAALIAVASVAFANS